MALFINDGGNHIFHEGIRLAKVIRQSAFFMIEDKSRPAAKQDGSGEQAAK
jgi:hypothetical protein